MSNPLSAELKEQMFGQVSGDPFIALFTLSHPSFSETLYLANDSQDVVSNGQTFTAFPVKMVLPPDDNETARDVQVQFSNVTLELIQEFRQVTTPIDIQIDMVLASDPDTVQYSLSDLKLKSISYTSRVITGRLVMDDFLSTGLTSERYTPTNFPGLF